MYVCTVTSPATAVPDRQTVKIGVYVYVTAVCMYTQAAAPNHQNMTFPYIHTYIHTCTHTPTYIHIQVTCIYIHNACIHTRTYIHIQVTSYIHVLIHVHTYIYRSPHTYMYSLTYIHTYADTRRQQCLSLRTGTYPHIHTYIHIYIHTYIYRYTQAAVPQPQNTTFPSKCPSLPQCSVPITPHNPPSHTKTTRIILSPDHIVHTDCIVAHRQTCHHVTVVLSMHVTTQEVHSHVVTLLQLRRTHVQITAYTQQAKTLPKAV